MGTPFADQDRNRSLLARLGFGGGVRIALRLIVDLRCLR
jgi:hypothetical protein